KTDETAALRRCSGLQARTVVQQCSTAKVKIRPALDGGEPQWAELKISNSLMSTKFFRKDRGHLVSLLDLPGSALFVPQDSLLAEPPVRRKMRFRSGCEFWRGAQLLSSLVSACRELMAASSKCTKAGTKIEQGIYGQKQEIVLKAVEPLTLLLEF
uniref:D-aminoacyl-tRNA deacylase n=1 Tax=Stegastes partitus TaxID=144197 RepID=A0A3B4ZSG5_9TELE